MVIEVSALTRFPDFWRITLDLKAMGLKEIGEKHVVNRALRNIIFSGC